MRRLREPLTYGTSMSSAVTTGRFLASLSLRVCANERAAWTPATAAAVAPTAAAAALTRPVSNQCQAEATACRALSTQSGIGRPVVAALHERDEVADPVAVAGYGEREGASG